MISTWYSVISARFAADFTASSNRPSLSTRPFCNASRPIQTRPCAISWT
jgi:hypothetical protein